MASPETGGFYSRYLIHQISSLPTWIQDRLIGLWVLIDDDDHTRKKQGRFAL